MKAEELTDALYSETYIDPEGHPANIVDGLFAVAVAIEHVAKELRNLGNADAATPMGAIEAFGDHIGRKLDMLGDVIAELKE